MAPEELTRNLFVDQKLIAYSFGDRAAVVEFLPHDDGMTIRIVFWQAILDNFARYVEARQD